MAIVRTWGPVSMVFFSIFPDTPRSSIALLSVSGVTPVFDSWDGAYWEIDAVRWTVVVDTSLAIVGGPMARCDFTLAEMAAAPR